MKLTYSIQVCNESRELFSLLAFLLKLKDPEDEIVVVIDSLHTTDKVARVREHFKDNVTFYERPFDNFLDNANFHIEKATGDYIFQVDADEMPQESLIRGLKKVIEDSKVEMLAVPRINIHPGATEEFIAKCGFQVNENGWINWPDFQGRIFKRNDKIRWGVETLHSKLVGFEKAAHINAIPQLALWHIKSVEKQDSRWLDGKIQSPTDTNLYDLLM
jgi:GT2 family glycosyltransferase